MMKKTYTFIDLFAGIGGFHTAMHYVGGKCVLPVNGIKMLVCHMKQTIKRLSLSFSKRQGWKISLF